jgi:hypothetical protein
MLIDLAILFALVTAMGATIVKVYEWRQDVLHGPYLGAERSAKHETELNRHF